MFVVGETLRKLMELRAVNFTCEEFADNAFVSHLYTQRIYNPYYELSIEQYERLEATYKKYKRRAQRNSRK